MLPELTSLHGPGLAPWRVSKLRRVREARSGYMQTELKNKMVPVSRRIFTRAITYVLPQW